MLIIIMIDWFILVVSIIKYFRINVFKNDLVKLILYFYWKSLDIILNFTDWGKNFDHLYEVYLDSEKLVEIFCSKYYIFTELIVINIINC